MEEEEKTIWICNDCGKELLGAYCVDCKSINCEKKKQKGAKNKTWQRN